MSRDQLKWDVIVTNASNRIGYGVLRSLARNGLRVGLGVDHHSGMGVYSRYCAGNFRHPSHDRDPLGFMDALAKTVRAHCPAVYMPADEDAFVVAEHAHLLRDVPVRTALAPFETLRCLNNKHESFQLAASLGIPTPATIQPKALGEIEAFARDHPGPLVLKFNRSSGGRGVFLLQPGRLRSGLQQMHARWGRGYGDFIVQEFIRAPGYGVSMLFDHGEPKASFTHRRLRELSPCGGPSTLRQSIRQPVLEAHAERLLRHVKYHGMAMVEFKHDEATQKTWFLEVNPRWWGSLALAIRAGIDFPLLFHRLALGENLPPPPNYQTGVTVRWLLGDLLALKNHMFSAGRIPRFQDLSPKADGYDDFFPDDPLPLAAELVLHLRKTVRAKWPGVHAPVTSDRRQVSRATL
jgi:predicted ATP-grasp superfamily ATP-dependent carboligase